MILPCNFVLPESLPVERREAVTFKRANPFGALSHLMQLKGVGGLVFVFACTVLAQFILQNTSISTCGVGSICKW